MCGIFGFSKWDERTRMVAPFLAREMLKRGGHSWGVTNSVETIKHLGKITDTNWLRLMDKIETWDANQPMVFHTRFASTGKINIENQHPFVFEKADGTKIVGVHNGMVVNHDELNIDHDRDFTCDSMHIFAHIAEEKPMEDIVGYGAIVYFEGPYVRFSKFNMYDFHVARLDDLHVWCSNKAPIDDVASMLGVTPVFYELDDDRIYFISENTNKVTAAREKFKFGTRFQTVYPAYGSFLAVPQSNTTPRKDVNNVLYLPSANDAHAQKKSQCKECYRDVDEAFGVVCGACLSKIMEQTSATEMVYQ